MEVKIEAIYDRCRFAVSPDKDYRLVLNVVILASEEESREILESYLLDKDIKLEIVDG